MPAKSARTAYSKAWLVTLMIVAILVLTPFVMLIQASFSIPIPGSDLDRFGFDGWRTALASEAIRGALFNTVKITAAVLSISLPTAIMVAWLIGRTDMPGRHWLEFGFWISFFLPPLAVVQGWILLLDPGYGLLNVAAKALFPSSGGLLNIYSMSGIVFAHCVTTSVSAKIMLLTPSFQLMDSRYEEAARMSGDGMLAAMRKIVVPVVLPMILVVAIMGIIRALESFEIELVLGLPARVQVYSTWIYGFLRQESTDHATASALGVLIMVPMLVLALAARAVSAGKQYTTVSGHAKSNLVQLGAWRWPACILVASLALLLTVIPITFLAMSSVMTLFGYFDGATVFTFNHWKSVLGDPVFKLSLGNTVLLGAGTSVAAMILASIVAYGIVRGPARLRPAFDLMSWVPFTMPGVLFSFAVMATLIQFGLLRLFYGTTAVLIIAVALASFTLGVQIMKAGFMQISEDLEHASWMSGASRIRTVLRIVAPLVMRSVVIVAIMSFISAARNISHLALLVSSDNRPLAVLQFEYMVEGRYEAASVVGLMVVTLTIVIAFGVRRAGLTLGPSHLQVKS